MKKFIFFTVLWIIAISLQSFFDVFITNIKLNIFFCIAYPVLVLFRKTGYSLYLAWLGLSYDYLSFSLPASYMLVFFIAFYIGYLFLIRKDDFWRNMFLAFILFCSMHLLWISINYFFTDVNYFQAFFTKILWIEILPTILLLFFFFPVIKKLANKILE